MLGPLKSFKFKPTMRHPDLRFQAVMSENAEAKEVRLYRATIGAPEEVVLTSLPGPWWKHVTSCDRSKIHVAFSFSPGIFE